MATDQDKITVYVPKTEGTEFRAIIAANAQTMTAVIRRFIREYVASERAKP